MPLDDRSYTSSSHDSGRGLSLRRRVATGNPEALDVADLHLVLAAIPHISHGRNAANRNGALVRLLLYGMFRRSELIAATWEDVDDISLSIIGKGSKPRVVPIADPVAWNYVQAYTNDLHLPFTHRFHGPLLRQLDHEERPLTRNVLDHLVHTLRTHVASLAYQERLRGNIAVAQHFARLVTKLHCHIFRSTGATYLAAGGLSSRGCQHRLVTVIHLQRSVTIWRQISLSCLRPCAGFGLNMLLFSSRAALRCIPSQRP